jgi:hypothetical protein
MNFTRRVDPRFNHSQNQQNPSQKSKLRIWSTTIPAKQPQNQMFQTDPSMNFTRIVDPRFNHSQNQQNPSQKSKLRIWSTIIPAKQPQNQMFQTDPQIYIYIHRKNINFERSRWNNRELTTETEELRHGNSSKNPGRWNLHWFAPDNPPKRAKKREPKKTKADTTTYRASKQEFMRELGSTRTWKPYQIGQKERRGDGGRKRKARRKMNGGVWVYR